MERSDQRRIVHITVVVLSTSSILVNVNSNSWWLIQYNILYTELGLNFELIYSISPGDSLNHFVPFHFQKFNNIIDHFLFQVDIFTSDEYTNSVCIYGVTIIHRNIVLIVVIVIVMSFFMIIPTPYCSSPDETGIFITTRLLRRLPSMSWNGNLLWRSCLLSRRIWANED